MCNLSVSAIEELSLHRFIWTNLRTVCASPDHRNTTETGSTSKTQPRISLHSDCICISHVGGDSRWCTRFILLQSKSGTSKARPHPPTTSEACITSSRRPHPLTIGWHLTNSHVATCSTFIAVFFHPARSSKVKQLYKNNNKINFHPDQIALGLFRIYTVSHLNYSAEEQTT